ncbi:hypothetical protein ADK53_28845 [Streptomyces sp. WM6373]|uniref:DUF4429 domain-containing protein n=1 Tax=Streptomyces sp. WM6373 TaxID=1415556 RepID=UPI0006AEED8F|nr:DUF4429 domain-containing protein [Streptomyces sp. WM6373]KOU30223.1 hypothetical protein ADK53_28845 [Streptomyces sp. WM6373]
MDVKGVLGRIGFDGEWITITKTPIGPKPAPIRIRAADVTATRMKPGSRLFHGYVQFVLPDNRPVAVKPSGSFGGGRPPYGDPYSLSIPRRSNEAAAKLVAAVEQARGA